MYKHYKGSVGNNLKNIQITTKYRYEMMKQDKLKVYCKVAIEEACKRHKIEIEIIKVLNEHAHMIVDCPRTMSDAKLMQIIKAFPLISCLGYVLILERDILKDISGMEDIFVFHAEVILRKLIHI